MQNLGLRDDPDQEGLEKMGPLADPTLANAKNRGAASRRRRRGDENRVADEGMNEEQVQPAPRIGRSREEAVNMESSDMEEIWEAVAEVIQEMEVNTGQLYQHGEGGGRRREAATRRTKAGTGETMEHKEQQRQHQRETQQQRDAKTPEINARRLVSAPGSSAADRTLCSSCNNG